MLGVKHRKVLHKLEKSSDPEDLLKLKKALEQAARIKSIENQTSESKSTSISSKSIQSVSLSSSVKSIVSTSQESQKIEALNASDNKIERNLPPGYVTVPSNQIGEPDTFVCKVCHHSSKDVFSVNAVSNITLENSKNWLLGILRKIFKYMQAMGTGFICYIISKMIFSQKHMLSLQHIQSEEHKQKSISQERPLDTTTSITQEKVPSNKKEYQKFIIMMD